MEVRWTCSPGPLEEGSTQIMEEDDCVWKQGLELHEKALSFSEHNFVFLGKTRYHVLNFKHLTTTIYLVFVQYQYQIFALETPRVFKYLS